MRLISGPVLCNYYLTYRCNASCGFCDIWEKPSPYARVETVRQHLQDLKRLGVKVVDFTGGEPLLHRQLPDLLQIAKEMGFVTTITTNCLLYPKQARGLAGLVDMLHFSLDASSASVHDHMRGVACHSFVMKSIEIARQLGERPDILFTVFEDNMEEIDRVYRQIVLPENLVLILNPVFDYNKVNTLGGLSQKNLDMLKVWAGKKNVYLNTAFIALREDGGNQTDRPVCRAGSSTVVISPEGKLVLPCYHLGLKHISLESGLYNTWKSAEVQRQIAMEGRHPGCQGCAINCYMQPSFAVSVNKYWFMALQGTLKYNWLKGTWKKMLPGQR